MPWRPHGRARVNARRPEAAGVCDRCGFMYNVRDLQWQFQWAGARLQNLRILVCDTCLDIPQEQLRARILAPDPVPILNARPEPFAPTGVNLEQTNYSLTDSETILLAEDGTPLVMEGSYAPGVSY